MRGPGCTPGLRDGRKRDFLGSRRARARRYTFDEGFTAFRGRGTVMQSRRFQTALLAGTAVLAWQSPEAVLRADELPPHAELPAAQIAELRAAVDRYCVVCHNSYVQTQATASGVVLDRANLSDPALDPALWERV